MPLNVRRLCTSVLFSFLFTIAVTAQTSADVMRERVAKAKAFIAVKNYNAAIYELENIRRETREPAVNGVINVLLMNSYLEQSDYKRAQEFLKELSDTKKQNNLTSYIAVAGQVVKGAKNQFDRYRALGLSVTDRNLPLEAITDVEKMRETLEMVVEQSRVIGKDKTKTSDAMALLEEATNARSIIARDDFDANRWKNEISDAREQLANSRSVIVNAVDGTTSATAAGTVAQNNPQINSNLPLVTKPNEFNAALKPVANPSIDNSKTLSVTGGISAAPIEAANKIVNPISTAAPQTEVLKVNSVNASESVKSKVVVPVGENKTPSNQAQTEIQATETQPLINSNLPKSNAPLAVGSLVEYVTQKTNPVYPAAARTVRMAGIVKVDVMIDEEGKVSEVQKTSGPQMLQRAAADAIKKWKFKPFMRDGQPIKAIGFVSFNFSL